MTSRFVLAQSNLAELRYPLGSPEMEEFESQLDAVNQLADRSPGFIWRQEFDYGGGDRPTVLGRDDYLFTLSVWADVDSLHDFTYNGRHMEMFRQRSKWFLPDPRHTTVLWWIPRGTLPTVDEAEERFLKIRADGPTQEAFGFGRRFPPPEG